MLYLSSPVVRRIFNSPGLSPPDECETIVPPQTWEGFFLNILIFTAEKLLLPLDNWHRPNLGKIPIFNNLKTNN